MKKISKEEHIKQFSGKVIVYTSVNYNNQKLPSLLFGEDISIKIDSNKLSIAIIKEIPVVTGVIYCLCPIIKNIITPAFIAGMLAVKSSKPIFRQINKDNLKECGGLFIREATKEEIKQAKILLNIQIPQPLQNNNINPQLNYPTQLTVEFLDIQEISGILDKHLTSLDKPSTKVEKPKIEPFKLEVERKK
ncbi:MAG: hypothetical protein J0H68_00785 [Sphingobacteriia bacterium]|nr:hypothetical protein [Sphingobacteriia bacterium]